MPNIIVHVLIRADTGGMAIRRIEIYDGIDGISDVMGTSVWLPEVVQKLGGEHNNFFTNLGYQAEIIETPLRSRFSPPTASRVPDISTMACHHLEIFPSMDAETTWSLACFIMTHGLAVLNTKPTIDVATITDKRLGQSIQILQWAAVVPPGRDMPAIRPYQPAGR